MSRIASARVESDGSAGIGGPGAEMVSGAETLPRPQRLLDGHRYEDSRMQFLFNGIHGWLTSDCAELRLIPGTRERLGR